MAFDISSLVDLSAIPQWLILVILVITIWKLIWYGFALYRSLEKKQKGWFVILFIATFILNDAGILAIIYLAINKDKKPTKKKKKKR